MNASAPESPRPVPDLVEQALKQVLEQYGFQKRDAPCASRPIVGTLDDFSEYLAGERDRKRSTIGDYRRDVKLFAAFIARVVGRPAETSDLTIDNFQAFVAAERQAGRAGSSVARRAFGLRAYWVYLFKRRLANRPLSLDEMDLRFKRKQIHQRILTKQEFFRLCTLALEPRSPLS